MAPSFTRTRTREKGVTWAGAGAALYLARYMPIANVPLNSHFGFIAKRRLPLRCYFQIPRRRVVPSGVVRCDSGVIFTWGLADRTSTIRIIYNFGADYILIPTSSYYL